MSKRIWMPMYWADYLGDTKHLTTTQHGAYLLLIAHYWIHGKLPEDDRALATIVGMRLDTWRRTYRKPMSKFFDVAWRHKRIEKELQRFEEIHERRSRAGVVGAAKRWQSHSKAIHSHNRYTTSSFSVLRSARKGPAEEES